MKFLRLNTYERIKLGRTFGGFCSNHAQFVQILQKILEGRLPGAVHQRKFQDRLRSFGIFVMDGSQ